MPGRPILVPLTAAMLGCAPATRVAPPAEPPPAPAATPVAPDSFAVRQWVGARQADGRHFWVHQRFVGAGGVALRDDSLSSACLYDRIPTSEAEVPAPDSTEVVRRVSSLVRWRRWSELGAGGEPSDLMLATALGANLGPYAYIGPGDAAELRDELGRQNPPVFESRCVVIVRSFVWSVSRQALLMWILLPEALGR